VRVCVRVRACRRACVRARTSTRACLPACLSACACVRVRAICSVRACVLVRACGRACSHASVHVCIHARDDLLPNFYHVSALTLTLQSTHTCHSQVWLPDEQWGRVDIYIYVSGKTRPSVSLRGRCVASHMNERYVVSCCSLLQCAAGYWVASNERYVVVCYSALQCITGPYGWRHTRMRGTLQCVEVCYRALGGIARK